MLIDMGRLVKAIALMTLVGVVGTTLHVRTLRAKTQRFCDSVALGSSDESFRAQATQAGLKTLPWHDDELSTIDNTMFGVSVGCAAQLADHRVIKLRVWLLD